MNSVILIWLLTTHYVGDFCLQTDWQAKNKSSNLWALTKHVLSYSWFLLTSMPVCLVWIVPTYPSYPGYVFILFNGLAHFVTDFFTSRLNSYLWKKGNVHNFFISVGFDQLAHYITLILSYKLFIN